ncbi:hypothetical protein IQ62_34970 [Streptomyces scabiei]|nr:hypothetical protein IQ62_34970 [Streptomyces scabiei]
MAGRGCTNPYERILLVTYQSEGVVALQVGADMVEQPAGGLPPDVLEDLHLPGVRRWQVGAAQQFCQRPRWRGQTRRHLMPAHDYRAEMTARFAIWEQITGVAGLATAA